MPLPTNTTLAWPPPAMAKLYRDVVEADAWWSGDPDKLRAVYSTRQAPPTTRRRFWSRAENEPKNDGRIHVPLAADIAQAGADLLFSEEPTLIAEDQAATDRLAELAVDVQLGSTLLEAADLAGGLSGVFLLPTWDTELAGHPLLDVIGPDRAVPEWRRGQLAAVTFWRVVESDQHEVWRHLERHEPGLILHGLYAGDRDHLGVRRPLAAHPATADLDDEVNLRTALAGWDRLLPFYVPNVRPNRRHRGLPVGRSDTQGAEGLMDALDRTMSSWMRDIDLGKMRLIVPDEFLDRRGRGDGASFDADREIFSPLNMDPSSMERAGITPVEFKIRTEEHAATIASLTERIILSAGYSPRSLGLGEGGGGQTATEVRSDETQSLHTTGRKQRYWRPGLEHAGEALLAIDRGVFGGPVAPVRPRVSFAEPVGADIREVASTLNLVNLAKAASIETRVRMLNPEWDPEQVAAEVAAIKAEDGVVDDPTGGFV